MLLWRVHFHLFEPHNSSTSANFARRWHASASPFASLRLWGAAMFVLWMDGWMDSQWMDGWIDRQVWQTTEILFISIWTFPTCPSTGIIPVGAWSTACWCCIWLSLNCDLMGNQLNSNSSVNMGLSLNGGLPTQYYRNIIPILSQYYPKISNILTQYITPINIEQHVHVGRGKRWSAVGNWGWISSRDTRKG